MINEHPTVVSRKEYLMNKAKKRTHIANLKPERMGMIDKRLAEKDFTTENELSQSVKVAKNAKAMRLNRRQMFKNAPLEDSYEPVITTKQVHSPLSPEIDLPALKQTFQNTLGRNRKFD